MIRFRSLAMAIEFPPRSRPPWVLLSVVMAGVLLAGCAASVPVYVSRITLERGGHILLGAGTLEGCTTIREKFPDSTDCVRVRMTAEP